MKTRLVNRDIAIKDRMLFLEKAYETLGKIIESYEQWMHEDNYLEQIKKSFKLFLRDLYRTRHFTFISIGGDVEHVPDEIDISEKLFYDLIDTIFSMSLFLERFINHQIALKHYKTDESNEKSKHQRYLQQIMDTDKITILRELNTIQMRINIFQRFIKLF